MAELNVQPRKKASLLPWILLVLGAVALIWFLTKDRTGNEADSATNRNEVNASANSGDNNPSTTENNVIAGWDGIDFNTSAVQYEEVTNPDVTVRSTADYSIYGINETILFGEDKAEIRIEANNNLTQILRSIEKRYPNGLMRIYGYTDAQGSAGYNKELAEQRAEAVKQWIVKNGIANGLISVNAVGETKPVATNSTEKGRQQNRRVEIVVRQAPGKESS